VAIDGPLANATVSFGSWRTTPPLDRHPVISPGPANHHAMLPSLVTIKAGGAVIFSISGFHQVAVYGPGTQAGDISTATLINGAGSPPLPPLIDDSLNRIYRGLDPGTQPRDRIEVVHFATEGTYLVICSVLSHFAQGMYGYVKVV
jgi:plastocyanin